MSELEAKRDSGSVFVRESKSPDAGQTVHPAGPAEGHADAAVPHAIRAGNSKDATDAAQDTSPAAASDAATRSMVMAGAAGHDSGSAGASGMSGASTEAGSTAPVDRDQMSAACPHSAYCYGFESGALDPSGALWPSPSGGSGALPPNQELTTTTYPASSQNSVLVSRPSSKDGWPKATVGFSGPQTPFSTLVVSFDYVAGQTLIEPNPRVILFRFVGWPERNGDSVNVGLLDGEAMLEVQTNGPDLLELIGAAVAPGVLTHVVATFTRGQTSCMVEVAYGALPLKAAAFPCEVQNWQVELGLDMVDTPPERYAHEYFAYFDNLQVSATP